MQKNICLRRKTIEDIDLRVAKVLKGLGNPTPPLRIEDVRELLKLDLQFYGTNETGMLREAVSKIKIATIQTFKRPMLLLEAIKKMDLKALYIPDRKRILLDKSLPLLKHRWNEAHEIGHSLLPWHNDMMLGDTSQTLTQV